jgi:membrane protein implicated in regulation of membrane protease activity
MSPASLWLIVAVLAIIIEALTTTFGFLFAGGAALCAALCAALGIGLFGQLICFAVSLIGSLVLLRPMLVRRYGATRHPVDPSRAERLVGLRGRLTEALDPTHGTGRVLVQGEDWAARSETALPAGTEVVIESADGIILNVAAVE